MPREQGMVLWTLRYGDEVRDPEAYFAGIETGKVDPKLLKLAERLIDERSRPWDASMVRDPVQERLLEIIAAKKKGRRPARAKAAPERPSNVISIMDALRRSIASEGRGKSR